MNVLEEIQQAEQQLIAAQLASDVAVLDTLIADDIVFIGPDGGLYTKAQDLEAHRSGTSLTSLVPRESVIELRSEAAFATVVVDLEGVFGGQPVGGRFRYLRAWGYRQGRWQIVAGSCTPVPV